MAKRSVAHDSPSASDLSCKADRLTAVLMALEAGLVEDFELEPELREALFYELLPHAIRMSRQLRTDLLRLEVEINKQPAVA